ncbi:MAG: hypothetical protein A2026_01715 [Deltaproteobacteria bacterium RBG_19FT_COMBO_46_12]|nr:MAG: hypothetical protein A2026_01715 [Deltaproteobacteria bacterium RBG_19FT_COMBO_46_12]
MQNEFVTENNIWPPGLKDIRDNSGHPQMEIDLLGTDNEANPLDSLINPADTPPIESKEKVSSGEAENPFFSSFLTELIHSIKNNLVSIKNVSLLSVDKFNDPEFRKYAQRSINEDIKKVDSVLNSLLNYIHINTPIIKTNTLSIILEEVIEANEKQIQSKNIKILKKCEKELPETFIHDEQLRFILNSILQYALLSTPQNGTIGFLLKSFDFQQCGAEKKTLFERNGYIQAAIGFMCEKEPLVFSKDFPERGPAQSEETVKLILQLVREILEKNHGKMAYEVDPKKPRTLITLRFPTERRKVIYYEPISI